ncbi:hypothetical protein E4U34_003076 [Claviceps purpurea]|nr:hypothetical protein E4U34_003076 [Claviceps purpurea]KAG6245992.1 hypothetical protein E4U23_004948 [Claviceps purpurea]
MKLSYCFALLLPATAGTALPLSHRGFVPSNRCCFTLPEAAPDQISKQAKLNGVIALSGDNLDGWFCIDDSNASNVLWDASNNAYFIISGQTIQCLDPVSIREVRSIRDTKRKALGAVNGGIEAHLNDDNQEVYTPNCNKEGWGGVQGCARG